ncbi:ParB/RepB/Spo0J family partition protein [Desulfoluna butyratoxydans]|uniref:Parb/sulfiredoxin n=1 Tax=Desulfoluna butyratoxydans TaxID=231438 RepID=A0A4U8YJH8_9BACT|nr:ParB/RepB/Spo0J family partition protein [Desulfoluna butyratoxydans]VFQ43474.1 parb/sulfiredoxin [Desulfoluna butyratoxydans]
MKKLGSGKSVKLADVFSEDAGAVHQVKPEQGTFLNVPVDELKPNPYQPRLFFKQEELDALAASIKKQGVLLPLCIFIDDGIYYIGDGERRWRASRIAGKKTVPCYVTTGQPAEVALIGNMLRSDLKPIEEAEAYARMQEKFSYTQAKLARVVGKSRNNITETLSLNRLPEAIKKECLRVDIAKRKLIQVARKETPEEMEAAFNRCLGKGIKPARKKTPKPSNPSKPPQAGRISAQVWKIAEEVRKMGQASFTPGDSAPLAVALKGLLTELERIPAIDMSKFHEAQPSIPDDEKMQDPEEGLHLSGTCRGKLLDAGFRLFRVSEHEKVIKELSPTGSWKHVSRHTTKKAMKEVLDEILQDPMSVKD